MILTENQIKTIILLKKISDDFMPDEYKKINTYYINQLLIKNKSPWIFK